MTFYTPREQDAVHAKVALRSLAAALERRFGHDYMALWEVFATSWKPGVYCPPIEQQKIVGAHDERQ